MTEPSDESQLLKEKLTGEMSTIPWRELQRFFAQGRAVLVAPGLDLIEVAILISEDRVERIKHLMDDGRIDAVSDTQARAWFEADALVWAVVVRPWVLVQAVQDV
jgi:hypothetical protein